MDKKTATRWSGYGAVLSHCVIWISAGVVMCGAGTADGAVSQENVVITLPIFVTSIIATAVFTWNVRGLVSSRDAKINHLESQISRLLKDRGLPIEEEAAP